jgi:exonuclease SbcD
VPAQYAGSLLPLDFGEAGERKRVAIVDVEPGSLATVTSVPIVSGRPLRRESGTWDQLAERAEELAEAYLDLTVRVGGPDPDLGRRAAETFPYLVRVRAELPAAQRRRAAAATPRTDDVGLYAAFHEATYGEPPSEALSALVRRIMEDVDAAV